MSISQKNLSSVDNNYFGKFQQCFMLTLTFVNKQ